MAIKIRPVRGEIQPPALQAGRSRLSFERRINNQYAGATDQLMNFANNTIKHLQQLESQRIENVAQDSELYFQNLAEEEYGKAINSGTVYTQEEVNRLANEYSKNADAIAKQKYKNDPEGFKKSMYFINKSKIDFRNRLNRKNEQYILGETSYRIFKHSQVAKNILQKYATNINDPRIWNYLDDTLREFDKRAPTSISAGASPEDVAAERQSIIDSWYNGIFIKRNPENPLEIDYEGSYERLKLEKLHENDIPLEQKKRINDILILEEKKQQEKDTVDNNNKLRNLNLGTITDEAFQNLQFKGPKKFELKEGLAKSREKIIDKTIANKANVIASNYFTIEIEQGRYLDLDKPVHIAGLDDEGESYSFNERLGSKTFDLVDKDMSTMITLVKLRDDIVDGKNTQFNNKFNEFKDKFKKSVQGDNRAFAILRANEIFTTLRNKTKKLYDEGVSLEEIFDDLESKHNIEKNIEAYIPTPSQLRELRFKEQTRDVNMKDFLQEKNNIKKLLEEAKEAQNKKQIKKIQKQFDAIKKKEKRLWFMPPPFDENTMTDQEYLNSKLYKSWEAQNSKVQAFRRYNNIRKNN